jgi:hypothetical protein
MTEGQGLSDWLEGPSLRTVVLKFVDNPFTNNKVIASDSKNQVKFRQSS